MSATYTGETLGKLTKLPMHANGYYYMSTLCLDPDTEAEC